MRRRRSMPAVLDPGFDLVLRQPQSTRPRHLAQLGNGSLAARNRLRTVPRIAAADQPGNGFAVPRDDDLSALLDFVDQAGEIGLRLEDSDLFHRRNMFDLVRLV